MASNSAFAEPSQRPTKRPRLDSPSSSSSSSSSSNSSSKLAEKEELLEDEVGGKQPAFESDEEDEDDRMSELVCDEAILDLLERKIEEEKEKGDSGFEELTVHSFRKLVLQFEKRYSTNQDLRIQFPNKPAKFMDSEVQLDLAIANLHQITTSPELYPELVRLNVVGSLVSLLSHENTDIANDAVDLIKEITDPSVLADNPDCIELIVEAFLENNFCSLLIQNLERLNEKKPDEATGVFDTLSAIENLTELSTHFLEKIIEESTFLTWLVKRVTSTLSPSSSSSSLSTVSSLDHNKLYSTEILSIILQSSEKAREKFGEMGGILSCLTAVAVYKRRDPETMEEEEWLENIFDCLSSSMLFPPNKLRFIQAEGLELMLLILKGGKYAMHCSLKLLGFVLDSSVEGVHRFIDILGLKTIFSIFMKKKKQKGVYKHKKKPKIQEEEEEEYVLSIIYNLLSNCSIASRYNRVIFKFTENHFEKIERLVELHHKYLFKVKQFEEKISSGLDSAIDLIESEEELTAKRLENGLYTLQIVDLLLLTVAASPLCVHKNTSGKEFLHQLFGQQDNPISDIRHIVLEYIMSMEDNESEVFSKKKDILHSLEEVVPETNKEKEELEEKSQIEETERKRKRGKEDNKEKNNGDNRKRVKEK